VNLAALALVARWLVLGYFFGVVVMYGLLAWGERFAEEEDKSTAVELLGYALGWFLLVMLVVAGWDE
jgi:purine-cytosine permease-like protein